MSEVPRMRDNSPHFPSTNRLILYNLNEEEIKILRKAYQIISREENKITQIKKEQEQKNKKPRRKKNEKSMDNLQIHG